MIYFLYGDNDFLIDQRVDELCRKFVSDFGEANVVNVDINSVNGASLMSQLTAISLFGSDQLIIVKGITSDSESWSMLESNLSRIPDTTTVILTDIKQISKIKNLSITKTFKTLKSSNASLEKFDLPKSWDVSKWLAKEVKKRELNISSSAQQRMLSLTSGEENQQARLSTELDKLSLLNEDITDELVNKYVEPSVETNAFAVFEAAVTGQVNQAITMVRQLRSVGEDVNRFVGLLASQLTALSVAATGAEIKISPYQLSQAKKLVGRLNGDKAQRLKCIASVLANMDAKVKADSPDIAWVRVEVALAQLAK